MDIKIGIMGGSGLQEMDGFKDIKKVRVNTPFGNPSDEYLTGMLEGKRVAFLPRHGRGHVLMPSEINYRANIYGFKKLGVERIISVSAVGSMKEDIKPGEIVLASQFYDNTRKRISSFFGDGLVVHVGMAEPVCGVLGDTIMASGRSSGVDIRKAGTYLCMEGPQFSTGGESAIHRKWDVDMIGMTNMPEAKLAREAEICYATVAMITDYDCWHETDEAVTVEMVVRRINSMSDSVKAVIRGAVKNMPVKRTCGCSTALKNTIITSADKIPAKRKKDLDLIIGKYL